jgi:hypothetical protein
MLAQPAKPVEPLTERLTIMPLATERVVASIPLLSGTGLFVA